MRKATESHQWLIYAVQTGRATQWLSYHTNVDKRLFLRPSRVMNVDSHISDFKVYPLTLLHHPIYTEAEIWEESAEFYRTLLDLLRGQDEEHLRWQGSFREGGKVNLDTLGSQVWLEQFRYTVHGLHWFANLTRAVVASL